MRTMIIMIMVIGTVLIGCSTHSDVDSETQAAIDKEMREIEEIRAKAREKIETEEKLKEEKASSSAIEANLTKGSGTLAFDDSYEEESEENTVVNGSTAIRITNSVDDKMTSKVYQKYYLIPDTIATDFNNRGWEVEIVHESDLHASDMVMGTIPSTGATLGGLTVTGDDKIYLTDGVADICANHEMGHYVDMIFFGNDGSPVSDDSSFIEIYNKEKNNFEDDYPKSDPHEYFAETFSMYIEYGGDLKADFPRTYEYMDGLISPYGGTMNSNTHMSSSEKGRRNRAEITEAFDFDGVYSEMLKEIGIGIYEGLKGGKVGEVLDGVKDNVKGNPSSSMSDRDWGKAGAKAAEKANEKLDEIDKKLRETDWERKGEEIADKLNSFLGE